MQQTIRRNLIVLKVQTTFVSFLSSLHSLNLNLQNVRMFVQETVFPIKNPPITKAPGIINIWYLKSKTSLSKRLSMLVGISEAIRLFSTSLCTKLVSVVRTKKDAPVSVKATKSPNAGFLPKALKAPKASNTVRMPQGGGPVDKKFLQWLAGVIDGDGCFQLSKKGYGSLEIVMETRDKRCLYLIKQKFGGSAKIKSDVNYLRYRLHHKEGLIYLLENINGLLRNPVRILQFVKLCDKYNVSVKPSETLTYDSAWLSGFFDSDGSICINLLSSQVFISASQKNRFILDALVDLYGGAIYPQVKVGAFKWTVFRKDEIAKLREYFKLNSPKSAKQKRLKLLEKYYTLRSQKAHLASANSLLTKNWKKFLKNWENYK